MVVFRLLAKDMAGVQEFAARVGGKIDKLLAAPAEAKAAVDDEIDAAIDAVDVAAYDHAHAASFGSPNMGQLGVERLQACEDAKRLIARRLAERDAEIARLRASQK